MKNKINNLIFTNELQFFSKLSQENIPNYKMLKKDSVKIPARAKAEISNLISLIVDMKFNKNLKEKMEIVRSYSDKDKRQEIKKDLLPVFSFNEFNENQIENASFLKSKVMPLDIDGIGYESSVKLKNILKDDPSILLSFIGPSGNGVKFFVKIPETDNNVKDYKELYKKILQCYQNKLNVELDPSCKNPSRLTFYSFDNDLYYNPNPINFKL